MSTTTIRIDQRTHTVLAELAEKQHTTIMAVLARAVRDLENRLWWQEVHASYAQLKADPVAWQDYQDECKVWEATLMDGLEDEPPWED